MKRISALALILFIQSCGLVTPRPKLEMSMAAEAFMAAKNAKADVFAPGIFRKAEVYYLKAKSSYRKKYFNKAKEYALQSKEYSEKAELTSRKKALTESP